MLIYPTIEIKTGKCVSLVRGRIEEPAIWHVDPVKMAQSFAEAGAHWMQVTDLDGVDGQSTNRELVKDIIRQAGIPVQLAGGFSTLEQIDDWIDQGVARIVIGSAAVKNPQMVRQAAKKYPDQIVLAVDVYLGKVATDGWRETTMFEPIDMIKAFEKEPLAAILLTDVDAVLEEGTELGAAHVSRLAEASKAPLIVRGLVKTLDDLSMIKYTGHAAGVFLSRPLFERTITLTDALAIAHAPLEKSAEFI